MSFGSFISGAARQVNPFDNGATYNKPAPVRTPAPQQARQQVASTPAPNSGGRTPIPVNNVRQALSNPRFGNANAYANLQRDNAPTNFNVKAAILPELKKQAPRVYEGVGLAGARSLTGTAQAVSGVADLLGKSTGTSRVSKGLDNFAKTTDNLAKRDGVNGIYKPFQAAGDAAQFLLPGIAAAKVAQYGIKGAKVAGVAAKLVAPTEKLIADGAAKLATKGVAGRVAGAGLKSGLSGSNLLNAGVGTLQDVGQGASKGQAITPQRVGIDALTNLGFGTGIGVAGQLGKEVVPATKLLANGTKQAAQVTGTKVNQAGKAIQQTIQEQRNVGAELKQLSNEKAALDRRMAANPVENTVGNLHLQKQMDVNAARTNDLLSRKLIKPMNQGGYAKNPFGTKNDIGDVTKEQSEMINDYANMLESMGQGNGVNITKEGIHDNIGYGQNDFANKQVTNNYRDPSLGSKALTKAQWFDHAREQLESGKAPDGMSEFYKELPTKPAAQPKQLAKPQVLESKQKISGSSESSIAPTPDTAPTTKPTTQLPNAAALAKPEKNIVTGALGNSTPKMSIPADAPSSGMKVRGLATTIAEDPNTPASVKQGIQELYKVRNTKDLQARAANLVKDDPNLAMRVFKSDSTSDVGTMIGGELSGHLSRTGQHDLAIEVAQQMSRDATHRGQANQALSAWGKLAPESILRFAQHTVNDYNKTSGLAGTAKELKLTPSKAQELTDLSAKLKTMPDGQAKDIATKQLLTKVKEIVPASWVQKLSTLQTIGQLFNPKTMIRNVGGNTMFGALENVSQTLGAGIDASLTGIRRAAGSKTAMREVALPNLKTQAKGYAKGAKQQYTESTKGVNLGPDTQYDLADVPAFRGKVMGNIEKAMGITLRVPDRAAFTAAYDDTLQGLMKANKVDKPTQAMLDQAEATGLYRTFQDNSKAAKLFAGLKQSLNQAGVTGKDGKMFGLGDLILKYPKTPGNILARGMDYSPVGIVKGIAQASIHAAQKKPFDQASLVNSLSRGTVGTGGLVGSGAVLGALGIITDKPSTDTDTRNLQKASGQGGYQINTSALKRFISSGFSKDAAKLQKGDTLVSYDWAQPLSIPLSAGASMSNGKGATNGVIDSIAGAANGLNTLVEQPLVTGVQQFSSNIKNKGVIGAFGAAVQGAPASFVPTISNQVRQLTDNNTRNTYDPNAITKAKNQVINRIPGLDRSLPNKLDALGNNQENYQNGGNNAFNVLANPAFVTKYQPNGSAQLPLDILNRSGETKQIPTTTKTTQKVNGNNLPLTAQQNHDFQQYVGKQTDQVIKAREADPRFQALSDVEKANNISGMISKIQAAARVQLLGDTPSKTNAKSIDKILSGDTSYTPSIPKDPNAKASATGTTSTTYDSSTGSFTQTNSKTGRVVSIAPDGTRTVVTAGSKTTTPKLPTAPKTSRARTGRAKQSSRVAKAKSVKLPRLAMTNTRFTTKGSKRKSSSVTLATYKAPKAYTIKKPKLTRSYA